MLGKKRTTGQIKADIAKLEAERISLQTEITACEDKIADSWHSNTATLEATYNALCVRLKASEKVMTRLEAELEKAEIAELLASHEALEQESRSELQVLSKARARVQEAELALEHAKQQLEAVSSRRAHLSARIRQIASELEKRGIAQAKIKLQKIS